jgi:hypothetical protein
MKTLLISFVAASALTTSVLAADMVVKAPKAPEVSPWDYAFGAAVMSDYNFRGITQSNHRPSVNAYFEPRYNVNDSLQLYVGVGGYSIAFPNNAAAEIDFYGGIRPTFGKLALDFGVWYYYYPGGRTFVGFDPAGVLVNLFDPNPFCTNLFTGANGVCNALKGNLSFIEYYAKGTFNVTDAFAVGAAVYYDPSWLNSGASGTYLSGNAKYTFPATPTGWGGYISAEVAHYWLGTTDSFYGTATFPNGIDLPDYTTWNIGFGVTYKVFTVDFRYYDTDLSRANCNVLTGDHTATFNVANISAINPSGLGSNWCRSAFIVSLKADVTAKDLK